MDRTSICSPKDIRRSHQGNGNVFDALAIVSHELLNPLSAIMGWEKLLKDGHLDKCHK
ncbi:MAG TPA: hypothetical protein VEV84_04795 [Pyrinomonadaceae bacterium]|nr:hypothetical protein [Pyrinomonadaceae bacterium]